MAAEQDWREKYREAVSKLAQDDARWAKTQNVLKLLIGRLCLAAQGRDDLLDEQLTRVSDSVRKQIDPALLEGMIAPLSSAVQALDAKEAAAAATRTGSTGERKAATDNGNNRADSTGATGERKLATPVDQQRMVLLPPARENSLAPASLSRRRGIKRARPASARRRARISSLRSSRARRLRIKATTRAPHEAQPPLRLLLTPAPRAALHRRLPTAPSAPATTLSARQRCSTGSRCCRT
jgi:hypothetical protein